MNTTVSPFLYRALSSAKKSWGEQDGEEGGGITITIPFSAEESMGRETLLSSTSVVGEGTEIS